jgi:hypothetical protein
MGVGLRPSEKFVDLPPNLKVVCAAFLSRLRGRLATGIPTATLHRGKNPLTKAVSSVKIFNKATS